MKDESIVDEVLRPPEPEPKWSTMSEAELRGVIDTFEHKVARLEESLVDSYLHYDNIGWKPMGTDRSGDGTGIPIDRLKKIAETAEAMATTNPLVKRGIEVRTAYIWGSGVGMPEADQRRDIRRTIGSSQAQFEAERTLAATGNLFYEVTTTAQGNRIRSVPMTHVEGLATNREDPTVVEYIKIRYNVWDSVTQGTPGDQRTVSGERSSERHYWVPTVELEDTPLSTIDGIQVRRDKRIKQIAVNRMVGWWWGVPDLYAVTFWVLAYKKYLEQCATLNEAYARFAFKASADTAAGGNRMAEQMAEAPGTDPATGQPLNVGGTAIMGRNMDLSVLQTVRPVDFTNGLPLAAMVAAGLGVPLQVMTSDPGAGGTRVTDEALDEATKKSMEARQQAMDSDLRDIFTMLDIGDDFEIDWPEVGEEPLHRVIQALDMAGRTGMLHPDEWRALLVSALDIRGAEDAPPTEEQLPVLLRPAVQNQPSEGDEEIGGEGPAQTDPPSAGDHELRDEGLQTHITDPE